MLLKQIPFIFTIFFHYIGVYLLLAQNIKVLINRPTTNKRNYLHKNLNFTFIYVSK